MKVRPTFFSDRPNVAYEAKVKSRTTPDFSTGAVGRMELPSTDLGKTEDKAV